LILVVEDDEGTARTVDNFVASLRKKIETGKSEPPYIRTIPRVGYRSDEKKAFEETKIKRKS
jgi:DNA-binding response OmpR family regulator